MRANLIEPLGFREQNCYLHMLKQCYDEQVHLLQAHLGRFSAELDAAQGDAL
jgi:hypothetical protein